MDTDESVKYRDRLWNSVTPNLMLVRELVQDYEALAAQVRELKRERFVAGSMPELQAMLANAVREREEADAQLARAEAVVATTEKALEFLSVIPLPTVFWEGERNVLYSEIETVLAAYREGTG
jgi:hypothetical protein